MLLIVAALLIAQNPQAQSAQNRSPNPDAAADVAMFAQVYPRWNVPCDEGDMRNLRVVFDVEIDRTGHFVRPPVLVRPIDSPEYRAVAASALTALTDAEPFDVPARFEGGRYRPTFVPGRVCPNR